MRRQGETLTHDALAGGTALATHWSGERDRVSEESVNLASPDQEEPRNRCYSRMLQGAAARHGLAV